MDETTHSKMKDALKTRLEYQVSWSIIRREDEYEEGNRYVSITRTVETIEELMDLIDKVLADGWVLHGPQDLGDFKILKRIISEGELTDEERKILEKEFGP